MDRLTRLEARLAVAEASAQVTQELVLLLARKLTKHSEMTAEDWNSVTAAMAETVEDNARRETDEGTRLHLELMVELYRGLALPPDEESSSAFKVIDGGKADSEA